MRCWKGVPAAEHITDLADMSEILVVNSESPENRPQYLMLARKTPYQELAGRFSIYAQIEKLASDEKNHIILTLIQFLTECKRFFAAKEFKWAERLMKRKSPVSAGDCFPYFRRSYRNKEAEAIEKIEG